MLKEIVGSVMSVVLLVYMLWFVVPELKTAYNGILPSINQTSPTMVAVLTISNGWFYILPVFVVFIGGYTIWLYATRREGYDV